MMTVPKTLAAALMAIATTASFGAVPLEWRNLDEENHFGGRVTSPGYMRGKVVMVDCRDYGSKKCVEAAFRMQEIWATFKMKPFVLMGSHRGEAGKSKISRIAEGLGLTYPIYDDAGLAKDEPTGPEDGFFYVIDFTGKVLYSGPDERSALGMVTGSLMSLSSPQTPRQWKYIINYDIDILPGRAYLELTEFKNAFPDDFKSFAAAYARMAEDKNIQHLAKLEELSRQAKDYDRLDKRAKRLGLEKIEGAISKYSSLKTLPDPNMAQEAKNCLADLIWAAAGLKE